MMLLLTKSFHLLLLLLATVSAAPPFHCEGGSLYVVAHPDDDLLFLSPDLLTELKNQSRCVTTVYLTSGDGGQPFSYARVREAGSMGAYSLMVNVTADRPVYNNWEQVNVTFAGQLALLETLQGNMNVQHVWIRLPDGNYRGDGFPSTNNTSLAQLYSGQISTIQTLPLAPQALHLDLSDAPVSVYTLNTLRQSLIDIVRVLKPQVVRTQDWTGDNRQDHSDHIVTAKLVKEIMKGYPETKLVGYVDYATATWPQTLEMASENFTTKMEAFFYYTQYDYLECQSWTDCLSKPIGESYWLLRQYRLDDPHP